MISILDIAKIITIAHQKGGVGKSSLALNLAYRFSNEVIVNCFQISALLVESQLSEPFQTEKKRFSKYAGLLLKIKTGDSVIDCLKEA